MVRDHLIWHKLPLCFWDSLLVWIKMGWHLVIDAKQFNTISTILNLIFIFILIDNEKIMVVTVAVTAVMSAWASANGTTWEQYTLCTLSVFTLLYISVHNCISEVNFHISDQR